VAANVSVCMLSVCLTQHTTAVHLAGSFILLHEVTALGTTEQPERYCNVLKLVNITLAVLLPSGTHVLLSAGYMTGVLPIDYTPIPSHSLKWSNGATLSQVYDVITLF